MFLAELQHVQVQRYKHYSCYVRSVFDDSVFNNNFI